MRPWSPGLNLEFIYSVNVLLFNTGIKKGFGIIALESLIA